MTWLRSELNISYDIEGQGEQPRKEIREIPETVFKENLVNALVVGQKQSSIFCKPKD